MHNELYDPPASMPSGFLQLMRVWEVRGDHTYHIRCPGGYWCDGTVLLRTLAGEGYLDLAGARVHCPADSLVLVPPSRIHGYGTVRPHWQFWWFECGPGTTWPFPSDTPLAIPAIPDERRRLESCARQLRKGALAAGVASAELLLLCHQWLMRAHMAGETGRPHRPRIEHVMQLMQATAERPLPIRQLAMRCHLSEGQFRRLFHQVAGCTPKAYYDSLRLARAIPLLRQGQLKIAEIAQRLHYSSPFHFSRAFRRRHGQPPSAYRSARDADQTGDSSSPPTAGE